MAHVFISYKRNVEPDEAVSAKIFDAFTADGHDVFIDRTMSVGTHWAAEIETNVRQSDFLIILLTQESSHSELVKGELEIARDAAEKRGGKPHILPVRLAYSGRLPYPLSSYLDPLQYACWDSESDTPHVIGALRSVVSGADVSLTSGKGSSESDASARPEHSAYLPSKLPPPGGTIGVDDQWYIPRAADTQALHVIRQEGGRTISIKGPRQMGKSSLLVRVLDAALSAKRHGVLLDFQLFGKTSDAADLFFRRFAGEITEQLDLTRPNDLSWDLQASPAHSCTHFVEKYILEKIDAPMTLAIDEADLIFTSSFRNDFFGMLRSWHNHRAHPNPKTKSRWRRLDLVLVTSTEPYLFIDSADRSPFNVGAVLQVEDFTREQVAECNRLHASPLSGAEVAELYDLVGGHPYLTRKALYAVTGTHRALTTRQLFESAAADSGPFGDHLRNHLLGVARQPELTDVLLDVVHGRGTDDVAIYNRLLGAGLVKRESGKVVTRCRLYRDYFEDRLHRHG